MFEFDSYQLDPITVRLTKDRVDIEIEPQVFNTLLFLIENRQAVVTKDKLLEKIWHGRAVSDHVITRTIYELRKILDDKSEQDSHIRTVRGKGYQFVAEVTESQQVSQTAVEPSHSVTIPRHKLLWVIGLILMVAVSFVLINQYSEQSSLANNSSPRPKPNTYPIVSVLPIEVEAGNKELSMLVQSLIDYLTNQLAVNLNMKVIHPDSLVSMSDQLGDIWAIQKATRSDFIIQGFIESVTDQTINLHLVLYKNNGAGEMTPFPLGAFEFLYPKNIKELNDLYKQRKITVRSIVKIIEPSITVNDDGGFKTADPEAYRLVITAHHMSRSDDCKDMQRAEQLLLEAVERDDEFVYAYLQLFTNYYKRVWICGESTDYHQKGLAMAEIIDRLAPNTYQSVATRRSTILVESNQVEQAYEFSKNADWNNPDTIYHKSYSLRYAGFLNATSQNLDRILQLDPFFFNTKPIRTAPNTLLYQNRFKVHLALLAEPGNSYHDYLRGLNLFLTAYVDQATTILQGVVKRTPEDLFGKFSQALLHIINKDFPSAIQVTDAIVQQRNEKKHTDGEMTYKLVQLY
ncbi:MAG: winged helix-turn-helix domain-containing protein, partial [Proteobacteria bacterium]|nr:winged helix-turn-helix domain-containing protein [Pseudomonadota bacterium]